MTSAQKQREDPEHNSTDHDSPYSITEEELQARLNKPIYGHVWRQLFAGILACLSSISFGTSLGWAHSVSRTMILQDRSKNLNDNEVAWFISINLLGCSFGVTSSSFLMKQMGPKRVLQVIGPLYILNWWLILTPNIRAQLTARFFLGFLGVSYSMAGENLLMQTVHHGIRRYLSIFYNSTVVFGVLVSRILGTATTKVWVTVISAIIPMVHYVLIQIVPESPVFLYATSQAAAAKSLKWYRGKGNFHIDMAIIKKDWDASRQDSDAYRYMLFSKVVYRPLFVVIVVTFLQVTSGYFIFMFYSIRVLSGNQIVFTPVTDSALISACFIFTKIFWGTLHVVHRDWKVRGFLISSCLFSSICLGLFAVYLLLNSYEFDILIHFHWIPLVIAHFFLFFVDMGLNHFPKILVFEYMPFQMYKRAYSIVQAIFWLASFFIIYFFAATFKSLPSYIVFGCLAGFTFAGVLFCRVFVVEPKGKSLIQIQLEFGGNPIGTRGALYNQMKQTL